jgi:hypothetical protein
MKMPTTATLSEIETLLALGARIVRLARREKRPLGAGWQHSSIGELDVVEGWLRAGYNVGLLLGPESGVIDVESDTPEGEDLAHHLGLDRVDGAGFTPTWSSERGVHRLYRWEPWMPTAATIDLGGLEARIGGRAAQSVLPPSIHPSGLAYRWEIRPWVETSGRSCIAEAPESFRELLEGAFAGRGGR